MLDAATGVRRHEQVPEVTCACLGLELFHDGGVEVRIAAVGNLLREDRRGGIDPFADERGEALAKLRCTGTELEVHVADPTCGPDAENSAARTGWRN